MDKIVVLVLLIAVTLGLFSFSVLGQASSARDLAQFAQEEQSGLQVLMSNPNLVTGAMVLGHADSGVVYNYFNSEGVVIGKEDIDPYAYYTMVKEFTNGRVTKITFTETTDY